MTQPQSRSVGTGEAGQNAFPPAENLSYEQARDELIEVVKILEMGQMGLDESLRYWERGEAWRNAANSISTAHLSEWKQHSPRPQVKLLAKLPTVSKA